MAETANVDVVVEAFTEAAKEALDDVGNAMSKVATASKPASSGLDEAADQMDDVTSSAAVAEQSTGALSRAAQSLSGSFQVLQGRAEEAGDEISGAGRDAGRASGMFAALTASTDGLAVSFGTLSTVATLSLIPSLLTLSTVLAPIAVSLGAAGAGAGALVAALGGLAAVGAITHMQELKDALQDVRPQIEQIIQPLGEAFGPILVDAVRALPELTQAIVDSVGPLEDFQNFMRQLGSLGMEVIPMLTGAIFDLARAALPALINVIEYLQATGPAAVDAMRSSVNQLAPAFQSMIPPLEDLLPSLLKFGTEVLELVIPAINSLIRAIDRAMEFVLSLDEGLQDLAIAATISAPAILKVGSALMTLGGPLTLIAGLVAGLYAAYRTNFLGIRDIVNDALGPVVDMLTDVAGTIEDTVGDIEDALTDWMATSEAASGNIKRAFMDFVGPVLPALRELKRSLVTLGLEVRGLAMDVMAAFRPLAQAISSTINPTKEDVQTFAIVATQAVDGLVTIFQKLAQTVRWAVNNFLSPLIETVADTWKEHFGEIVTEVKETISALKTAVKPFVDNFVQLWEDISVPIRRAFEDAFSTIDNLVGDVLDAALNTMKAILNLIQGDFGEALGNIQDALDDVLGALSTLGKGVYNVSIHLVGAAVDAVEFIWDTIQDLISGTWEIAVTVVWELVRAIERRLNQAFTPDEDISGRSDLNLIQSGGTTRNPNRPGPNEVVPGGGTGFKGPTPFPQGTSVVVGLNVDEQAIDSDYIQDQATVVVNGENQNVQRFIDRQNVGGN